MSYLTKQSLQHFGCSCSKVAGMNSMTKRLENDKYWFSQSLLFQCF